jgi:hypothetical protein
MGKADALSRRQDHKEGVEDDNKDVVLLKPEFFVIHALRQGHAVVGEEAKLLKEIRESKDFDDEVVKAVESLKKGKTKQLKGGEWFVEQDLVLRLGKVYVPKVVELRRRIVELHHDTPIGGHHGVYKTLELIGRNYWWPGITKFVKAYVEGCDTCNRNKTS